MTKKKTRLHTINARRFLRLQRRLNNGYTPGSLGSSSMSRRIKDQYGTFITRRERRRLAKATRLPCRIFYNGHVELASKGGKAQ